MASVTSSTRVAVSPVGARRTTWPSGPMIAETPLVEATAMLRPSSRARARVISNCCSGWEVPKNVALLVCTVTISAPPRTWVGSTSS